jgi:HYDIN/CFA65/VesB-like, Ig-like domain
LIKVSIPSEVFSQIKIYFDRADLDTVDFGMRNKDNDVIRRNFIIENNSADTVWTGDIFPTFLTGQSRNPLRQDTHQAFELASGEARKVKIPPNGKIIRTVEYAPDNGTKSQIGIMEAFFQIGVSDSEDVGEEIYSRTYTLIGRASEDEIDMWDKIIAFDSVLIGDEVGVSADLNIRNNSDGKLTVESGELEFVTSELIKNEITVDLLGKEFPFDLAPKTDPLSKDEKFVIKYIPKDKGPDTALYVVKFKNQAGVSQEVSATISGTGVRQSLDLVGSTHEVENVGNKYNEYIINVGDIQLGDSEDVTAYIENDGNMRIGVKDIQTSSDNCEIVVKENIAEIGESIDLFEFKEFTINIRAIDPEVFSAEYILETDLLDRNIAGVSNQDLRFIKYKIRGRALAPKINPWAENIDFANIPISGSGDCSSFSEKELVIENIGNDDLIINYLETGNGAIFSAQINEDDKIIKEGEKINILVSFHPNAIGQFVDSLTINYSGYGQNSKSGFVYLSGGGTNPSSSDLKIIDQSFKPSSDVSVPIIVSGQEINIASGFITELLFNPTMLEYKSFSTLGTASEGADLFSTIVSDDEGGIIDINLKMPNPEFFYSRDTLLILNFDSYLGDAIKSQISFSNPKFSDENCSDLLDINIDNSGFVEIDSLCGVDNLIEFLKNQMSVVSKDNSQTNEIEFTLNSPSGSRVEFSLYDVYGSLIIQKLFNENSENRENIVFKIDKSNIISGKYFAIFKSANKTLTKQIAIIN